MEAHQGGARKPIGDPFGGRRCWERGDRSSTMTEVATPHFVLTL